MRLGAARSPIKSRLRIFQCPQKLRSTASVDQFVSPPNDVGYPRPSVALSKYFPSRSRRPSGRLLCGVDDGRGPRADSWPRSSPAHRRPTVLVPSGSGRINLANAVSRCRVRSSVRRREVGGPRHCCWLVDGTGRRLVLPGPKPAESGPRNSCSAPGPMIALRILYSLNSISIERARARADTAAARVASAAGPHGARRGWSA